MEQAAGREHGPWQPKEGPVTFDPTSGSDSNSPYAHAMKDPLVEGIRALNLEPPSASALRQGPSLSGAGREGGVTERIFERGRAMREVWGGAPGR